MKIILRTVFLAALFTASACISEEPPYKDEATAATHATGYLLMNGLSLRIIADTETDIRPSTTSSRGAVTRTQNELDDYTIGIYDAQGTLHASTTYGELSAQSLPLELPVGAYRMQICSESTSETPDVAWEHPVYGTSYDFVIRKGVTTIIEEEVTCKLQNIKVTLLCSADLAAQLSDDTHSTISLGASQMTFAKGEQRAAYFMPSEATNTLAFHLRGSFVEGGDVSFSKQIAGVKGGQWRKISLVIAHTDEGNVKVFDITVDTFELDETIDVNATNGLWEPIIDDNPVVAPTVVWTGHDLNEEFRLSESMFALTNGSYICTEPVEIAVSALGGIGQCEVTIESTNEALLASLESYGLPRTFDLCTLNPDDTAYTALKRFGFPLGEELRNATTAKFNLAGAMPLLYFYPGFDGTHSFSFRITDADDPTGSAATEGTLRIVVDRNAAANGGSILWLGAGADSKALDITQPYDAVELVPGMQIDIDIRIPAGIRNFDVEIVSPTLEPFLVDLNIPSRFDLCHAEGDTNTTGSLAAMLHGFGFPVNDEVTGKTEFDPLFSITSFVDLILGITPEATGLYTYDFGLTITDNNGAVTSGTIRLKITK